MDERVRSIVLTDARTAVRHIQARQLREQLLRSQMTPVVASQAARGELPAQRHDLFVQLDKAQRRFLSDALLTGSQPPINDTKTYENGKKIVPSYLLKPVSVDASNWKAILIDSGYYKESQIH